MHTVLMTTKPMCTDKMDKKTRTASPSLGRRAGTGVKDDGMQLEAIRYVMNAKKNIHRGES